MRNKVDINKLIKKKFNDKTFDYSDLDKEMDLILEKLDGYWGKVDTAELEEVSQGESVFDHAFGLGGAENPLAKEPGYVGREPSEVIPYKLAETGDGDSGGKTISIAVPDLFSLITNSEMVPGDQDRKLIQSVILNMKDLKTGEGNWIERIKSLQKYMDTVVDQNIVEARDIRRAISNLIFLNLMKKISFFVAQPGKLFEYIITPLIGTDAKVIGSVDQGLIDAEKESQGKTWRYSIKLFTGKVSDYTLKGSRKNLEKEMSISKSAITYIIAVANEDKKNIEFSELSLSMSINRFPQPEWSYVTYNADCIVLKSNKTQFLGVLVKRRRDDYYAPIQNKYEQLVKSEESKDQTDPTKKTQLEILNSLSEEEQRSIRELQSYQGYVPFKPQEQPEPVKAQVGASEAAKKRKEIISKFQNDIKNISSVTRNNLTTFLKNASGSDDTADKNSKDFRTSFLNSIEFLKKISPNEPINIDLTDLTWPQNQPPDHEKITQALKIIELIVAKYNQFKKKTDDELSQQTQFQEALIKQEEPSTDKIPEFKIGLKTQWTSLSQIKLELGDPKIYNQYQLKIASNLAEDTEKVLNAYKDLNTNLVKFFATSKEDLGTEPGKEPRAKGQVTQANTETGFGDAVIKNATDIEEGVRGFLEKEGTPSQVKE